jgi:hypothetical protein
MKQQLRICKRDEKFVVSLISLPIPCQLAARVKCTWTCHSRLQGGASQLVIAAAFLGKLWHPEEFRNIDPMDMLQEYMEFYDSNFDASTKGVFMYPSLADLRQ